MRNAGCFARSLPFARASTSRIAKDAAIKLANAIDNTASTPMERNGKGVSITPPYRCCILIGLQRHCVSLAVYVVKLVMRAGRLDTGRTRLKVSVAMCTYNGEQFLQEQLKSIQNQTLQPCEMIVCDDGSTDGTVDLLLAFELAAAFPVRIVRNETNLGSTRNFAQAIRLCSGDAIALCDQDDRWMPQKLALCAKLLEEDTSIAGVFSNASLMDQNGNPLPGGLWQRVGFDSAAQQEFLRDAPRYLTRKDTVTGAAFVLRARACEKLLPISPEWVHDGWLAILLATLGRLHPVTDALLSYRLHSGQQVGATVVPWSAHLSTATAVALEAHRRTASRFLRLAEKLDDLKRRGESIPPRVLADVRRKINFESTRAALLESPRRSRVVPALARLRDYMEYEKGLWSLLRDLSHAAPQPPVTSQR